MVGIKSLAALSLAATAAAHPGHSLEARDIAVGSIITKCTKPGVVALTFDDGPYDYTNDLLDLLDANGHKGTFFVNGDNYGHIADYAPVLQRMYQTKHQIGSHTWDHKDLATLSDAAVRTEMTQVEDALMSIIGVYPYYMRPPFLSTNAAVLKTLGSMGYHIIEVDIDTLDWEYDATDPTKSEQLYQQQYTAGGTISLNHDPEPVTVHTVVPWIINFLAGQNMKSVTVAECLGDTEAGWYRTKSVSSKSSAARSSTSSKAASSVSKRASATTSSKSASVTSSAGPKESSSSAAPRTHSVAAGSGSSTAGPKASPTAGTKLSSAAGPKPSGKTSPNDTCGGKNGYVCGDGKCCSEYGYCGKSKTYCEAGCQPLFGTCSSTGGSSGGSSGSGGSGTVSPDGTCGGTKGYTCPTGKCCSVYGFCGTGLAYCGSEGSTGGSSGGSTGGSSGKTSEDGTCGGSKGYTCGGDECTSLVATAVPNLHTATPVASLALVIAGKAALSVPQRARRHTIE